jgi:LPXTG-site transpeptidase (sortase) family protein
MKSSYRRPGRRTCLMLVFELAVLIFAAYRLIPEMLPTSDKPADETGAVGTQDPTATMPDVLSRADVLPTPTTDPNVPSRIIAFPGASMSAPIVPAGRIQGTWETRHLGDSVGHLVGTSWLDGMGGNIVLAGHVENASGQPGPFAHLFEAAIGDLVILREGDHEVRYAVTSIEQVAPDDISYVAQDGRPRLTLITCTDWDYEASTYLGRLVVVAEPLTVTAQN